MPSIKRLADEAGFPTELIALRVGDEIEVQPRCGAFAGVCGEVPSCSSRWRLQCFHIATGNIEELDRAIRAHGNFSEYVPLGLLLIGALELNGAPLALVALLGLVLVFGRFFHAKGINQAPPEFSDRVRGMKLTFAALGLSALANLAWVGYLFVSSIP